MKKEVLLSISGLQQDIGTNEPIEFITPAEYYYRDEKHFITYEEFNEETGMSTKSMIKLSKDKAEVHRKGERNAGMVFEVGNPSVTAYSFPFGVLKLGINTTEINIRAEETMIESDVKYSLSIDGEFVSDCFVHIKITER